MLNFLLFYISGLQTVSHYHLASANPESLAESRTLSPQTATIWEMRCKFTSRIDVIWLRATDQLACLAAPAAEKEPPTKNVIFIQDWPLDTVSTETLPLCCCSEGEENP